MKQRLLTPGPSPVPEETLLELAKPVFYHRSAQFRQVFGEVQEDLKYVYCTRNPIAVLTASGSKPCNALKRLRACSTAVRIERREEIRSEALLQNIPGNNNKDATAVDN